MALTNLSWASAHTLPMDPAHLSSALGSSQFLLVLQRCCSLAQLQPCLSLTMHPGDLDPNLWMDFVTCLRSAASPQLLMGCRPQPCLLCSGTKRLHPGCWGPCSSSVLSVVPGLSGAADPRCIQTVSLLLPIKLLLLVCIIAETKAVNKSKSFQSKLVIQNFGLLWVSM